jgi:hypothetical protein
MNRERERAATMYESLYEGGPFHGKIRFVAETAFDKRHIHVNDGFYLWVGRIENGLFLWRWRA